MESETLIFQSRRGSFLEAIANVLVGYSVALAAQMIIFPVVGVHATLQQNLAIGLFMTVVSIIRSYIIRRVFNRIRRGIFA